MTATSNSPRIAFQQAELGLGSLAVDFPATAPGRQVGQQLFLYDVLRLLVNVNIGGLTWREVLNTNPAGSPLAPNQPNGEAIIPIGVSAVTVPNARCTPNSVILVQAISPGIQAAAPVQVAVIPGAGSFELEIRNFVGALVVTGAAATVRYLIVG
jgi:hypothetical protein